MKAKKDSSGMRSATMPKEHWTKNQNDLNVCAEKYGTEFGNAESYDRMNSGLVNYCKNHKMKYE